MRTAARNRFLLAFVLTLLTLGVMVGAASTAYADDCLALGGNPALRWRAMDREHDAAVPELGLHGLEVDAGAGAHVRAGPCAGRGR